MTPGTRARSGSRKSRAGGLILGGVAWGLLAVQVARVLQSSTDPVSFAVTMAIPSMLSLALCTGGIVVYRSNLDDLALRISGWTMLGVVLFVGVLGGVLVYLDPRVPVSVGHVSILVNVAAAGAVFGFVIGVYDARQQVLHRDLREEYDHTIRLSQRLSVLARVLRHDLRNQLNVILGRAETVEGAASRPEVEEGMRAIRDAGAELETVSQTIGRFGAMLAEPRPETIQRMDLCEVVDTAVATVRDRHDVAADVFEVQVPETAPVTASPLLQQAVTELVENAIVHTDASSPRVELEVVPDGVDTDRVELRVTDTGPGIPATELAIHGRDIETPLHHSHGIGLWLVHWVVTDSGGTIEFDTDEGTTVHISLPT